MLVLYLLIHTAYGRDAQLDEPIFRNVSSCPEVGYFLRSQPGENLTGEQCYLCFCEDDGVAMCWKHHNLRCDSKSYVHDRRPRSRRSPGFADLFFQDAARDMFKKQTPEECKPFESSYSVGCPPVDWCIGCTVCDCNANGRWDCHVLSFCPGDKGKKTRKKKRTVINTKKMKPSLHIATPTPKPTTKRALQTKPTAKRTMSSKRPARIYMTVQSKMKGTASTKPTLRRSMPIQSKIKGVLPTKPTTRSTMPKTKRTVATKPIIKKTTQTKSAVKRTMETKPAVKRNAPKKPEKTTTVNKLNKAHQINLIPQNVNQTKIKTNQMKQINSKPRKEVLNKAKNSPAKKQVNSAKPVQKKTLIANVKPALRSFQKVTGKPITNNANKNKTVANTTILVKNISSKVTALRSFQKVTGKPITNNINKSKTLANTTVLGKNISSKVTALRSFQKVTGKPITNNINKSKTVANTTVLGKNISRKVTALSSLQKVTGKPITNNINKSKTVANTTILVKNVSSKVAALRSFKKITGKPITNNINKNKTVANTTVLVKNISSKVMKSAEKIINEKQKKLSKLINITDDEEPPKTTIIKSKFKSKPQSNSTIIEINKKVKEKVILDKKYEVTPKRLKRKK